MAKLASLLIRVLLPLALLVPTAVANAAPSAELDDQEFASGLDFGGMLFNFNLQRRIAHDYCESMIRAYNRGDSLDLSNEARTVEQEYGLPPAYAFETLETAAEAYCQCTDYYFFQKEKRPKETPRGMPLSKCSAYEIEYANIYGYNLPVAPTRP